jgi:hypothetical protein
MVAVQAVAGWEALTIRTAQPSARRAFSLATTCPGLAPCTITCSCASSNLHHPPRQTHSEPPVALIMFALRVPSLVRHCCFHDIRVCCRIDHDGDAPFSPVQVGLHAREPRGRAELAYKHRIALGGPCFCTQDKLLRHPWKTTAARASVLWVPVTSTHFPTGKFRHCESISRPLDKFHALASGSILLCETDTTALATEVLMMVREPHGRVTPEPLRRPVRQ